MRDDDYGDDDNVFLYCFGFCLVFSSSLKTKFTELFTDKFQVVRDCSFVHIMHYYLFCSLSFIQITYLSTLHICMLFIHFITFPFCNFLFIYKSFYKKYIEFATLLFPNNSAMYA
jgi:hypothetical protein